jgi:short-subunit dehydrogenase
MEALVTGASAGIGVSFAERLATDGYDLVVVARRRERLEELAKRLQEQHGVSVEVLVADLSQADGIATAEARTAGVDLLINNAGFAGYRPFVELDPAVADELIGVHVTATTRLTRAALPSMVERGSGAIVNVASLLAFSGALPPDPLPQRVVYGAAKSFVVVFTQLLASELAGSGVQVQVLCPGLVRTEFHEVAGRDPSKLPFGALEPEQVVAASLRGLELGEVVCAPGLADVELLAARDDAQTTLFRTAVAGSLAERYV